MGMSSLTSYANEVLEKSNITNTPASYENHKRPELVSFDDINYENFDEVEKARTSMMREQWIRNQELRITHDALRKCKQYHGPDAQKNCRPLILKYMKMIESYPLQGYLGYQKNDPSL
ncbi:CIC11C00000001120 [Sungouiella intermedia]|uniref:CIC11C00000001120 n=1 Tax=Sungouiella intermedia TaxID=45354 RepID=A0A1L0BD75_9ASCO|nr:CIC11C00000001120 [[Candida] intermedia]